MATLAVINVLKENRRRRFVATGGAGIAPRREAYRGIVHDDVKRNAVVAVGYGKEMGIVMKNVNETQLIPCQRTPGLCP
jgi:hypothetical protein